MAVLRYGFKRSSDTFRSRRVSRVNQTSPRIPDMLFGVMSSRIFATARYRRASAENQHLAEQSIALLDAFVCTVSSHRSLARKLSLGNATFVGKCLFDEVSSSSRSKSMSRENGCDRERRAKFRAFDVS